MQRITTAISAAAISLWLGTLGGGIVGFNIGEKLALTTQAPTSSASTTPSASTDPTLEPTSTATGSDATETQPPSEPGPQGEPGADGETGVQGPTGSVGPVGPTGERGLMGLPGPMGPAGPVGQTGSTGAQGEPGPAGPTGATGPAGATGATGPMGPVGPQGPSGVAFASSPATYDPGTKTIGIDQAAFEYLSSLGYLQFNTSATASAEVGRLRWNSVDGTIDLSLGGGQVTLQVGQEMVQPVKNNTSDTLLNGRAVRISGADAGRMTVEYADAADPTKTTAVIGVLTQDIAPGEVGFVTTTGLVRDLNTAFGASGSIVYVDGMGSLTSIKPSSGAVMVIGYIVFSDTTSGSVFVNTSTTFTPGAGLPCNAGPGNTAGIFKWETAGAGDYYLSCDITP